jgi:hypothetical protein
VSTDDPSVIVTDASGVEHQAFATSRVEGQAEGHTFSVIWVSFERGGQSIPWPAEFVRTEVPDDPS